MQEAPEIYPVSDYVLWEQTVWLEINPLNCAASETLLLNLVHNLKLRFYLLANVPTCQENKIWLHWNL